MKIGVMATISLAFVLGLPLAVTAGLGADSDSDGVLDVNDSCTLVANAAPNNCDTDADGYGNQCDGDYDQSGTVNATDFGSFFVPDFNNEADSGVGTDMDCSGTVNATDFGSFFVPQFNAEAPGPGLPCANINGTPCP